MPSASSDLAWALDQVKSRHDALCLYRDYDENRHRLLFATDKFRNTFGDLFREFADNMCDAVVDGITDRLQINSWTADGDSGIQATVEASWERNRGEARTGQLHRHAFRDGDGFAIVSDGKDGLARWHAQDPMMMCIRYDIEDPDEKSLVGKVWRVPGAKRWRVNLYYQDRLERWASKGSTNDGGVPSPAAFSKLAVGDPLLADDLENSTTPLDNGMPVFHFPNGTISGYGRSLLLPVIPLQDALNKSVADMLVAGEFHAYPQRWATGIETEIDPVTGQEKKPFQAGEGRLWRTKATAAQFGQFTPGGMTDYLDVQDAWRLQIGWKGYLPPHSIAFRSQSTAPSGVALLVAEGRTVKAAKDRQRDWGAEHRAMMAFTVNMDRPGANITGNDLEDNWTPPETRDMKALLEELTMKVDLGLPKREALIEMGYPADDVDKWLGEATVADAEAQRALELVQGGRQVTSLDQARTLNDALGLPGGPVAPNGSQTALAQA